MTEIRLEKFEISVLHSIQLEMLQEFDRVCRVLGLHYHLAAGSLLGAVRHGGFIPWDDDVDIAMPRKDYQKLLAEAPDIIAKKYFLQSWRSDLNFRAFYAKLRRNGSEFREKDRHNWNCHHGIYIDIFPFDTVELNRWWGRLHFALLSSLSLIEFRIACLKQGKFFSTRPFWQRELIRLIYSLTATVPVVYRYWIYEKALMLLQNTSCQHISYLATMPFNENQAHTLIRHNSEITDTILLPFEGHLFPAPAEFHSVLTRLYGDYMKLPAEDKRYPKHRISVFRLPEDEPYVAL